MSLVDLQKLQKLDLKSVDLNALVAKVTAQRDKFARVVVIVVSAFMLLSIVRGYLSQRNSMAKQIEELTAKIEAIQVHGKSSKGLKGVVAAFPKALDEEAFASQITQYASQSEVSILALNPGMMEARDITETVTSELVVKAPDFKSFLTFLTTLENSPYALRVDSCQINLQMQGAGIVQRSREGYQATLKLTLVNLKK